MLSIRTSVCFAAVAVLFGMVECGCYNRISPFVAPPCVTACAPALAPVFAPPCAQFAPPACAPYPVPYLAPGPPPCAAPYYDINQLYAVTKALDCSCGNNCNNSGLNVDQLLNKLVNALVYTTGGRGSSGSSSSSEPLISLDLLSKLAGGGLGVANLGLGGTDLLETTLAKAL